MTDIKIINITPETWTKIEGFSSRGKRVKYWYENIENKSVYLYKEPKIYVYNDVIFITKEIWTELIASKIGNYIGLNIPKTLPAYNNGEYGVLIKNFLTLGTSGMPVNELIEAKEILNLLGVSKKHNLASVKMILDASKVAKNAWNEYIKMFTFDTLIGNTDRHDENWGLLYNRAIKLFELAPIYDNASCLTYGENESRVDMLLTNNDKLQKFINSSRPSNLYRTPFDNTHYTHFQMIEHIIETESNAKNIIEELLKKDYLGYTREVIEQIQRLDIPEHYKITNNRKELILKILIQRQRFCFFFCQKFS